MEINTMDRLMNNVSLIYQESIYHQMHRKSTKVCGEMVKDKASLKYHTQSMDKNTLVV